MNIKIGPCSYQMIFKDLDPDTCGKWSMKRSSIEVDKNMKEDMKRQTACHEVSHIILRSLPKGEDDEVCAESFGDAIYSFILNNKDFVKWIQGK